MDANTAAICSRPAVIMAAIRRRRKPCPTPYQSFLTAEMVGNLLEENYAYINTNMWRPKEHFLRHLIIPVFRWLLLCAAFALLWMAAYYLYALAVFGPLFFAAPLRMSEWLPMAMIGVITPGLWSLLRPRMQPAAMRRGIIIGYVAAMPVAFVLALGFRMLVSPVVWVPGVGVILLIGMALGYAAARLVCKLRKR